MSASSEPLSTSTSTSTSPPTTTSTSPSTSTSTPTPVPTATSRTIEVERKFKLGPNTLKLLTGDGIHPKGTTRIHDLYWDTPDFRLCLANYWLRQRNGIWELKRPFSPAAPLFSVTTQYEEMIDPSSIFHAIIPIVHSNTTSSSPDTSATTPTSTPTTLDQLTNDIIHPFIDLITERTSYDLTCTWQPQPSPTISNDSDDDDDEQDSDDTPITLRRPLTATCPTSCSCAIFHVVIDSCPWISHDAIVEIETILSDPSPSQIQSMEQTIGWIAHELDVRPMSHDTLPKGKVERYLAIHNPTLYQQLVDQVKQQQQQQQS